MKIRGFFLGAALALASTLGMTGPLSAVEINPIPVSVLASHEALTGLRLSPDGRYIAGLTSGPGLPRSIGIWDTEDLAKPPRIFGLGEQADKAGIIFLGVSWVANDRLFVLAQQPVDVGAGEENRTFTQLARFVDVEGREWVEPMRRAGTRTGYEEFANKFLSISVEFRYPRDPDHVILQYQDRSDGTSNLYKVNVKTGAGNRILRLSENESAAGLFDDDGQLLAKQYVFTRGSDIYFGYELWNRETRSWERHAALEYPVRNRRVLGLLEFDPANPDLLIVADNTGTDLATIKGYDVKKRQFVETLFAHPEFEARSVSFKTSGSDEVAVDILAFGYDGPTGNEMFIIDPELKALQAALQAQFPGESVIFSGRSFDYSKRLIVVESARRPPTYFLLKDNRELVLLGSQRPEINPDDLTLKQFFYYEARDGLRVPAFITYPKGFTAGKSAPVPLIVMPHGGPWARDYDNWDDWVAFFVSRGFAVFQPQYRGSEGFGERLWKAGDEQWGKAMQDDKDDGVKFLVQQGTVDPARVVMWGYSYGGWAALTAAWRPDGLYRCAVAGAPATELETLSINFFRNSRIGQQLQEWTLRGISPVEMADKVSIPLMFFHGDRDQNVLISQSRKMHSLLNRAGIDHTYVEIKDMWHQLPMKPEWVQTFFDATDSFLRQKCGMTHY